MSDETWEQIISRYTMSLDEQAQEAALTDRMLVCGSTASVERSFNAALQRLETLSRQQAPQTRLRQAEGVVQHWEALLELCQERDSRLAERRTLGPEYEGCLCLGDGGRGDLVVVVVAGADGRPVAARVDGALMRTREQVCTCPDGQALRDEVETWRETAGAQLRAARVARIAGAAEIPESYQGLTLDTWAKAAKTAGSTDEVIKQIVTQVRVRIWQATASQDGRSNLLLLLVGNQGVGKSGLAAVVAQAWVDQERGVLFRSVDRLAAQLRAAPWRAKNEPDALPTELELLEALSSADLLVLDDLGVEALTPGNAAIMKELLFGILDRRMTACLPTLVTTNLTADEIMERYGARIHDRLIAPAVAVCVEVAVPNLRWPPQP